MMWTAAWRADPFARELADRHYSRQTVGAVQFVTTGSCCVFKADGPQGRAYWVTSWQRAEFTKHRWAGAWVCSAFRNEGAGLSSDLIRQAVAATRYHYGDPPDLGMVTFVDAAATAKRRSRKAAPGQCFLEAGFVHVGMTQGGLHVLQLVPGDMPDAEAAVGGQGSLLRPAA